MTPLGRELAAVVATHGILRPSAEEVSGERLVVDTRGIGTNRFVEDLVVASLAANVIDLGATIIGGVANSGTPWAVTTARHCGIPHCNVLVDGPRQKGLRRHVEPDEITGERIVLIDNWITTGGSLLEAERIVTAHGAEVVGAIAVSATTETTAVGTIAVRVLWPRDLLVALLSDHNDH